MFSVRINLLHMVYHNFIMSYNPHFNPKPLTYNSLPTFTTWSQSLNNLLPLNLLPYPLKNIPFSTFNPFHPPLIHQQNNFYNSNFSVSQTPTNLTHPPAPSCAPMFSAQSIKNESIVRGKPMLKSNEVI